MFTVLNTAQCTLLRSNDKCSIKQYDHNKQHERFGSTKINKSINQIY